MAGYHISWNELVKLGKALSQTIDLVLVGSKNGSFYPYEDSNQWRAKYDIVIKILDGDYWEVYSSNYDLIDFLEQKYSDTEVSLVKDI